MKLTWFKWLFWAADAWFPPFRCRSAVAVSTCRCAVTSVPYRSNRIESYFLPFCRWCTTNQRSGHFIRKDVSSISVLTRNGNGSYGTEERQRNGGNQAWVFALRTTSIRRFSNQRSRQKWSACQHSVLFGVLNDEFVAGLLGCPGLVPVRLCHGHIIFSACAHDLLLLYCARCEFWIRNLHLRSSVAGHGNTGDWCSRAGRGQIVLPTNRNGGMLRLIAPRHDDDDDDVASYMSYGWILDSLIVSLQIFCEMCQWQNLKLKKNSFSIW